MSFQTLTFQSIIAQFTSRTQYEQFLKHCDSEYDLKVYRVNTMTRQQATSYYDELRDKYHNGTLTKLPTGWHQNERRLFVWFVILYQKFTECDILTQSLHWQRLSDMFFDKDWRLLKYQYMNILRRKGRVCWTTVEDESLVEAYNNCAKGEWNEIAKILFFSGKSEQFKSAKNCRQRWNNHLNVEVKKVPWSEKEDLEMLLMIKQKGKKWAHVAKTLGHQRTEHQIKNRFNSLIQQHIRRYKGNGNEEMKILDSLISLLTQQPLMDKQQHSQHPSSQQKNENENEKMEQLSDSHNDKFTFLNNIIVIQEQPHIHPPLLFKQSFESNQSDGSRRFNRGMKFVNCTHRNAIMDRSVTAAIEDKLFGSGLFSQEKNEHYWMDAFHTPRAFFEDSNDKRVGDFKLSQKGSIQKSDLAASIEFFRLPRSDMSQEYRVLSASSSEMRTGTSYEFSSEIKEL